MALESTWVQQVHWGDKFQIQEHGLAAAATFLLARSAPLMEEAMAMAEAAIDAGPFCSTLFLSICSIPFSHLRPSSAGPFPSRSASFLASRGFANCVWWCLVFVQMLVVAVDGAFVGANVQVPHWPHLWCCRCCRQSYSTVSSCRVCVCEVSEFCCVVFASCRTGAYKSYTGSSWILPPQEAVASLSEFQALIILPVFYCFLLSCASCAFCLCWSCLRFLVCVFTADSECFGFFGSQELEALAWTLELMRPRYVSKMAMIRETPNPRTHGNTMEHLVLSCALSESFENQIIVQWCNVARMQNLSMTLRDKLNPYKLLAVCVWFHLYKYIQCRF